MLGGFLGLIGLSAIAGILVTATVTPAIAISGYTASSGISLFDSLPGNLEVDRPMEPTTIYAPTGEGDDEYYELASFYDQNREPIAYDEVSQYVYDALLSTEDPRYYEHGGVDLIGTARAVLNNAFTDTTQGGSSISQQYVKGVQVQTCERTAESREALTECADDATTASGTEGYQRKLQEMRYAITIEKEYSKEQILIGYLNLVNFGGSTYGIEAAAQHYFSKSAKDLNLNESATLAGIVNYPSTLRLDLPDNEDNGEENGYALTKDRRDQVLSRMLAEGTITQEKYDATIEKPIQPDLSNRKRGCGAAGGTAYFCQYVKNTIINDSRYDEAFGSEAGSAERYDMVTRGGLEVYTTLDNNLQYAAQQAMEASAPASVDFMKFGATSVQIDPKTGNVLSLAQNTRFDESSDTDPGDSAQIYAVDEKYGSAPGFSVGSTYKLFTLIAWLEQGRSVNEYVDGSLRPYSGTCEGRTLNPEGAIINNFNQLPGKVGTPREFTAQSLNTGFLAMAAQLDDVCDIHKVAGRMGVHLGTGEEIIPYETWSPGMFDVLGSMNIAPLTMASAYATVANEGVHCEPTVLTRVVDADGEEVPLPDTKCEQVIDEGVAATAAYALAGVMNATGSSANPRDGVPVVGKTGTHETYQTWMVETSTNVTTTAWIGNYTSMRDEHDPDNPDDDTFYQVDLYTNYTPNGRQMSELRYDIAKANQAAANARYGGDPFPEPDSDLTKVVEVDVPNVSGMSVDEATSTLEEEGFTVRVGDTVSGDQDEGLVERTSPSGSAPRGSQVTLLISDGEGGTEVPNVVGMSTIDAYKRLFAEGLRADSTCTVNIDAPEHGRVVSTDPSAGTQVEERTQVTLHSEARVCQGNGGGFGSDDDDDDDRGNGNNGRGNDD